MNGNREKEIKEISIEEIIPNRFQPRLAFDERELKELSDSIKMHGIIQPLVLRRINDKYEIIAGERRYKAACLAGLAKVPAIIMEIDDNKSAELAVVENLQRKNLTAIEEAQSYKKILDKGYITQEELAARMGISQPTIANKIRLLNLDQEVQDALLANKISERHARSLLQIPDKNIQVQMLRRIIAERLTVRQADEEISRLIGKSIVSTNTEMQNTPSINNNQIKPIEPNITENKQEQNATDNIFNMNINNITSNSQDIIKKPEPVNMDMLLKPSSVIEDERIFDEPKKINLEETETNISMGDIVNESRIPFNPFIEEKEPELINFQPENKTEGDTSFETNPIINEFREQQANNIERVDYRANTENNKTLSNAINTSRETIRKLENLGFDVDTEEFDFEDMYQIIIKIKK